MGSKMKVWECNECHRGEPCRMISEDVRNLDGVCLDADWHEATRFEITQRVPEKAEIEKNCTAICYLHQCNYAYLKNIGFGCKFEGRCEGQRPLTMEPINADMDN